MFALKFTIWNKSHYLVVFRDCNKIWITDKNIAIQMAKDKIKLFNPDGISDIELRYSHKDKNEIRYLNHQFTGGEIVEIV